MSRITTVYLLTCALTTVGVSHAAETPRGDIVTVESVQYQNQVVIGGTVVPARQVLIAAQLPGRIEYLAGTEGDSFKSDTILVALEDDELLAQRRAAIAAMQSAEASWRNAGTQLNRELVSPQSRNTMSGMGMPGMFDQMFTRNFSDMMGLNSPGMDRHADIYSRTTAMEQARSAYDQARSQLDQIDSKLRDAVGRAPFDGVIIEKLVEQGDTVQPGTPLLRFADTETLQIQIDVPARLMPGVRQEDMMQAKLDVRDTPVKAKVSQIFPMADPVRHTVTVKLDLPVNAPAAPGMYAEVMVNDSTTAPQNLPVIPLSALVQRGSLPAVYVINSRGEKEMRVVRKGQMIENDRVIILSGLRQGEQVLNNPLPSATPATPPSTY